jgi:hypothetical protein
MYMSIDAVTAAIKHAIESRKILGVKYQRVQDGATVERRKAPFDIGTTNPKYIESHKDNVYMFCYDHVDEKTGMSKQIVHPVKIGKIISIVDTGKNFDENELADIHLHNTGYDYRICTFAFLPKRNWFR